MVVDRIGQIWWARWDSIVADFEPCIIVRKINFKEPLIYAWELIEIEKLGTTFIHTFSHFENQFRAVENGVRDDAWIRGRIA